MSENNPQTTPPASGGNWLEPGPGNVILIYILYLVGFVIGVTALVAIVLAHVNRGRSQAWVETHYTWAIRTFWIGLLYSLISTLLLVVGIGFLLYIVVAIWVIVRCVIGLQQVTREQPIKNPQSWIV